MEWHGLPPLAALRALAAFADAGSVAAAGRALSVSHAAVSQQLRALEAHMGVGLLDRSGRSMKLTGDGEIMARACAEGFAGIARAAVLVTGAEAARALQVSPTPSFAAAWLMPRLPEFRAEHPGIDLVLNPTPDFVPLSPGGVDAAIRYGTGGWDGLDSELLVPASVVVVAAPRVVAGLDASDPACLGALPWLEEVGTTESSRWLARLGAAGMPRGPVTRVPGNLVLDGARDGQGVAAVVRNFVAADIAAGRLVVLHEDHTRGAGYHLVTRPGARRPALRAFARWIRKAARA